MEECLSNIIQGKVANIPVYDFKLNSRVVDKYRTVYPNQVDVVLFEGILTFYNPKVRTNSFNITVGESPFLTRLYLGQPYKLFHGVEFSNLQ